MAESADDIESDLVDLTDLSLAQVRSLDESALGNALRRVRAEAENPAEALAGFSSKI